MKLRPIDDRVVIEPMESEEVTEGGIVLPDTAKEKPVQGKIVAVGPGRLLDNGNRLEPSVKKGDVVIYGRYSGSDVKVEGTEYKVMRESEILARYE
jgi:chaperonin GroES